MPDKKIVRLKVFLCDFQDVRAPAGYGPDFIRKLFFDPTSPEKAPPPDQSSFGATAFEFFFAGSDGWLRLEGNVTGWAHSNLNIGQVPHWRADTMKDPTTTSAVVNFGELGPVIAAETLRSLGFTSAKYPSPAKLKKAVLGLPNNLVADRLVFLHTDFIHGGGKRSFGLLKSTLINMSSANNQVRLIPGTTKTWATLWDEAWLQLPDCLLVPIILPKVEGVIQPNGSIAGAPPAPGDLRMGYLSIIFHELGHLVADLPDLYGPQFAPWGVFDLMGGPAASTHFPMPFGSYARYRSGWLAFKERSREDHQIRLRPLESHNDAIRLMNGAPGSNHHLVLENRDELHYLGAPDKPPTSSGRMLLPYRLDEHERLRVPAGAGAVRKITGVVRLSASYGEAWKAGMSIGSVPPPNEIFASPATCRNALGELWWTVDKIAAAGSGDLLVDAKLRALHLLGDYHRATWQGTVPGQPPKSLGLDFFGGAAGHVMLQDATLPIKGKSRERALYLHPRWASNAAVQGTYDISALGGAPFRLYAKLAMPDEAVGSDGTTIGFTSGAQSFSVDLQPGDCKEVCVDFLAPGGNFQVIGQSGATATRDWIYILDGWLVPLAPMAFDFLASAAAAKWTSGAGPLAFGLTDQPTGEVSLRDRLTLHTGVEHAPRVLFTHPNWTDNGFVQGEYGNVAIPKGGAFLRAAIGWRTGRTVTSNGVKVTVGVKVGGADTTLIENADLNLYPAGASHPWERNDLTLLELPLPKATWGQPGTFRFRVDTAGSAAQDWVSWPYLALTTA